MNKPDVIRQKVIPGNGQSRLGNHLTFSNIKDKAVFDK